MTTEEAVVDALTDGENGTIIVSRTLFTGTMGGQCGDTGVIRCADGEFEVKDTVHLAGGKIGHIGRMTKGMIKNGDKVELAVNASEKSGYLQEPQCNPSASEGSAYSALVPTWNRQDLCGRRQASFDFSHFPQ